MFNEHEISFFLEEPKIKAMVAEIKKKFIQEEAELLEMGDHDFLSLIMITPSIGIDLANGNISLFEDLTLNKMARKMSKGEYFLKKDPVAYGLKFLINDYDNWEMPFLEVINKCMYYSLNNKDVNTLPAVSGGADPIKEFLQHLMNAPYGMVRFLTSFFLHDENNLVQQRKVSKVEFDKIVDLGEKLKLNHHPVMQSFLNTFIVK